MNIRRIVLFSFVFAILAYLVGGLFISTMAVRGALNDVAEQLNTTISTLVADNVSEPLRLGSFVEARARILRLVQNGTIECADLSYEGMPISTCEKSTVKLRAFESKLNIGGDFGSVSPTLTTYVNEEKLREAAIKRSITVIIFVLGFGLIFLVLSFFLLGRIRNEILITSDEMFLGENVSLKPSFIHEINILREKIRDYERLRQSQAESKAIMLISRQVAHDIRSPVMALEIALRETSGLSPERRSLIANASIRIQAIANDLLKDYNKNKVNLILDKNPTKLNFKKDGYFEVNQSIKIVIDEKQISYPKIKFEIEGTEECILIAGNQNDFQRISSNLIQNSVEALFGINEPTVKVSLKIIGNRLHIAFLDNGHGVPMDIISKIGEEGFSFNKEYGNGLGISFAKIKVNEWGGHFKIESDSGLGTVVTIEFPIANIKT